MFTVTLAPIPAPFAVTQGVMEAIRSADRVFLQTLRHPSAQTVLDACACVDAMDDLYEASENFDELNQAVARRLAEAGDCVYAFTGNIYATQLPAVLQAVEAEGGRVRVLPGPTLSEAAFPDKPRGSGYPASQLPEEPDPSKPLTVEEIDSPIRAGEVKLRLMEYYPDDWEILLFDMDEQGAATRRTIPLYQLDQQQGYTAATTLYAAPVPFEKLERFGYRELTEVIKRLRAPDGCPWDREQTHKSLKASLMEECYELLDAIDEGDDAHMTEELGDVLMQVVMHGTIGEEQGRFTGRDITTDLVKKLVYRHPHVFGGERVNTAGEVLKNWEKLKKAEKDQRTQTEVLKSVPRNLPALTRSRKVQKKAANVGFDWPDAASALPKVTEELTELSRAMAEGTGLEEEMGDLLFSVVNVSRLLCLDPEFLLLAATDKFIGRFAEMESLAREQGKRLEELTLDQQNMLWDAVKKARNLA